MRIVKFWPVSMSFCLAVTAFSAHSTYWPDPVCYSHLGYGVCGVTRLVSDERGSSDRVPVSVWAESEVESGGIADYVFLDMEVFDGNSQLVRSFSSWCMECESESDGDWVWVECGPARSGLPDLHAWSDHSAEWFDAEEGLVVRHVASYDGWDCPLR